jgi:hypothetical protein
MAWKTEKWLSEVFPGEDRIYSEYRELSRRELAIVAAAVLDVALAELLSKRLLHLPKEYEDFLGLDEDGRAPAAAFGARIQLALLLGVITDRDAAILREVKHIRNRFSHRVRIDFTSATVKPHVIQLHELFRTRLTGLLQPVVGDATKADELRASFEITPDAGAGLLLAVLTVYQAYFHRLSPHITRVPEIHIPKPTKYRRSKRCS